MADEEANYEKPSSQVDLETRLRRDNAPVGTVLSTSDNYLEKVDDGNARDFRVEEQEIGDYVGTDVIYQNYANETEKPYFVEDTAEGVIEREVASTLAHTTPGIEVGSQDNVKEEKEAIKEASVYEEENPSRDTPDPHTPPEAILDAKHLEGGDEEYEPQRATATASGGVSRTAAKKVAANKNDDKNDK